ncbi:hypothetical protein [Pseudomonas sp. 2FE]|uniref:hypothetical protein n=1 Tax=Pseudomonas sp. 2FE TaxID=2502190 RepID=UPI0010F46BD3|nr:hypothetical protein [Pseudomonas sp. 2FE]
MQLAKFQEGTYPRLHHQRRLLVKGGAGPSTYYQLADASALTFFASLEANTGELATNTGDLRTNTGDLDTNTGDLPMALRDALAALSPKARRDALWPLILWLCAIRPHSAEQLAQQLGRQMKTLKSSHLNPLREQTGRLEYLYPEVVNHPQQAYRTTEAGRTWLAEKGLTL